MASFSPVFTIEEDDIVPQELTNNKDDEKPGQEEDEKLITKESLTKDRCTTVAEKTVGTVAFCMAMCLCFGCCSLKEMRDSYNEHTCCGQCCPM
jgi:hypothetical protein